MKLPAWIESLPPFRGRKSEDGRFVKFHLRPRWHRYQGLEFSGQPCIVCGLRPEAMIHDEYWRDAFLATYGMDD